MSNIRGGHKKLILGSEYKTPINSVSLKYLSFLNFDSDLKILHYANGLWYTLSYDPNNKITGIATNYNRMYLTYQQLTPYVSKLAILHNYFENSGTSGTVIRELTDSTEWLISYITTSSDVDYDTMITLVSTSSGINLHHLIVNASSNTLVHDWTIYASLYDYRTVYYSPDEISWVFTLTDSVIKTIQHKVYNGYVSNQSSDHVIGVGTSTLTDNVIIFTTVEEFVYEQQSGDDYYCMGEIKVYLSTNKGVTFTDISSRLNPTYQLSNIYYDEYNEVYKIDINAYRCESIYWTASSDGRCLCGVQPPYNKHTCTFGESSTTRFHISYNFGRTFLDEKQVVIVAPNDTFFLPVCSNIGANGNLLLGKYIQSFEYSASYEDHLQLYVYNVYTHELTEIPPIPELLSEHSFSSFYVSSYQISSDGNKVIVGVSYANIIGSYQAAFIKLDISDVDNPSVIEGSNYIAGNPLISHSVASIITNF